MKLSALEPFCSLFIFCLQSYLGFAMKHLFCFVFSANLTGRSSVRYPYSGNNNKYTNTMPGIMQSSFAPEVKIHSVLFV